MLQASFGSLELRKSAANEFIGQEIDVGGMEQEVLQGASATLGRSRPIVIVEQIKASSEDIASVLASHGYERFALGLNPPAVHPDDPTRHSINVG